MIELILSIAEWLDENIVWGTGEKISAEDEG